MDIGERCATGESLELLDRTHTDDFLAIIAYPDRNRVTPESIAAEAPVACILQPVVEPLFLDI